MQIKQSPVRTAYNFIFIDRNVKSAPTLSLPKLFHTLHSPYSSSIPNFSLISNFLSNLSISVVKIRATHKLGGARANIKI